ncbi:MAG: hypothetical protein OEM97_08760, partial [Acidimicrobiia bacterium]|nr:hypothetical protein [Acidimicrobiia bacterium]
FGNLGVDEAPNDLVPEFGVAANLVPFGSNEWARLPEDPLVNVDFADVVQRAGDVQAAETLGPQPKARPDRMRETGDAVSVGGKPRVILL